jgi:hypothetical protein
MLKRLIKYVRGFGAFSLGMLIGTIYGSIIATMTTVSLVGLP